MDDVTGDAPANILAEVDLISVSWLVRKASWTVYVIRILDVAINWWSGRDGGSEGADGESEEDEELHCGCLYVDVVEVCESI